MATLNRTNTGYEFDADWTPEKETKSRELAEDLAEHLRASRDSLICYTEMGCAGGRMDVWALKVAWGDRDIRAYEVKISRADFWNDVNKGKYEKYLPFCKRLYFAVPSGLVKKSEVPEGCGLITRNANGWRTVVPATPHEATGITMDYVLDLVKDIHWRETKSPARKLRDRAFFEVQGEERLITHRLGREVQEKLDAYDQLQRNGMPVAGDYQAVARRRRADDLLEHVETLLDEQGFKVDDLLRTHGIERLAEFAVHAIRYADDIREIGSLLTRLPYRLHEEVQSTLTHIESHS